MQRKCVHLLTDNGEKEEKIDINGFDDMNEKNIIIDEQYALCYDITKSEYAHEVPEGKDFR